MTLNRREFIGAASAASLAFDRRFSRFTERSAAPSRPVVIASANGIRGVAKAYDMITKQNADTLDAIIAGVNIQELDPEDQSVGLGGLPNEDGIVQLDASCMHGPTRRAGAVGALEDIATPSLVAKAVMDHTDHIMLVGAGAKKFALEMGFRTQNLLTEQSRRDWLRWKSKLNASDNWLDPVDPPPGPTAPAGSKRPSPDNQYSGAHVYRDAAGVAHTYGTINMNAVTATGDIASVTTTSGLSWKIPGRVGDSPIIGAGQYCDNEVGAAGSTGRGEATIKVCGSFLAVEFMRQGMSPEAALMKVMERVIAMTETRLLNEKGRPYFDLEYYAINKKGEFAGARSYEGGTYA